VCWRNSAAFSDVTPEDDEARLLHVVEVSEFDGLKVNFFVTCFGQ
jgi:hypothetical protein